MNTSHYTWLFIIITILTIVVSFILIKPFITATLTAVVLSYIFYPFYTRLENIIKNKALRSLILLVIIFSIVLAVAFPIINLLVNESVILYHNTNNADITRISSYFSGIAGENIDLNFYYRETVNKISNNALTSLSDFIFTLPHKGISLFIIIFMMYYLFKDGDYIVAKFEENLPLRKSHREVIIEKFNQVMYATIYGIIVTSIIQGILGTIGLFIFKVNSPIIWGLVMTIAAMFPYFGTSVVWVPASLIKIFNGDMFNGFGLLLYGIFIIGLIDNVLNAKLISHKTQLHPIIILLGVIGGLKLFGFVGLILGPVLLSTLVALMEIYNYELKSGD